MHGEFIKTEQAAPPDVAQPVSLKIEPPAVSEDLNALLASIKRDLNDAAYG